MGHEQTSRHIRFVSVIPLKSRHSSERFARPLSANSGHPTHDANPTRWRYASQSEPEGLVAAFRSGRDKPILIEGGCQTRSTGTANTYPMPRLVWMTRGALESRSSLR